MIEWFTNQNERHKLIKDFNSSARQAFISGITPTMLCASITMGNYDYKHSFSKILRSGFRLKALTGRKLGGTELREIGEVILGNDVLVRKLMSFGWDTLEVYDFKSDGGLQWRLDKYAKLGGYLNG